MYGVWPFIEQFNLHLLTQKILQINVKTWLLKHVPNFFIGIVKFNLYLLSVIFFEALSAHIQTSSMKYANRKYTLYIIQKKQKKNIMYN